MFTEALIVLGENDTDDDILNRSDRAITGDVPDVALSEEVSLIKRMEDST